MNSMRPAAPRNSMRRLNVPGRAGPATPVNRGRQKAILGTATGTGTARTPGTWPADDIVTGPGAMIFLGDYVHWETVTGDLAIIDPVTLRAEPGMFPRVTSSNDENQVYFSVMALTLNATIHAATPVRHVSVFAIRDLSSDFDESLGGVWSFPPDVLVNEPGYGTLGGLAFSRLGRVHETGGWAEGMQPEGGPYTLVPQVDVPPTSAMPVTGFFAFNGFTVDIRAASATAHLRLNEPTIDPLAPGFVSIYYPDAEYVTGYATFELTVEQVPLPLVRASQLPLDDIGGGGDIDDLYRAVADRVL